MSKCPCLGCDGDLVKRLVETSPALVPFAIVECLVCDWKRVL